MNLLLRSHSSGSVAYRRILRKIYISFVNVDRQSSKNIYDHITKIDCNEIFSCPLHN